MWKELVEQARFAGEDSFTGVPSKSTRIHGKDLARPNDVPAFYLDDNSVPRRDATGSGGRDVGAAASVPRFAGVGYLSMAAVSLGRHARDVDLLRSIPISGCDMGNVEIMDYIGQGEHLEVRRFSLFPVQGHAEQVVLNSKHRYLRTVCEGCVRRSRESQ